ncbi:olfactory receptor 8G17-like [Chanodichthys erythropterus]|uniref:olfactory receptor 8G17-like n=1 Tax=Chanodichthys erythropterus TaxID=933992 RepID=UPI00351DF700
MDNLTLINSILLVEGLKVTPQSSYAIFILLFLFYVFAMGCNIGLIILIAIEKNLHHPMHFLFCNLPVNDIIGTTVILPRLMQDIFKQASDRYITYVECVIQAYFVHIFATASHTALVTMAYDRQVAICNPLLYTAIMTNKRVVQLSAIAWALPVIVVAIMLGLTVRLSRCKYKIENPFCDNASLYKLSCENVSINNMFGIVYSVLALSISVTLMIIAYVRIVAVCIISKNKALNSKAIKTCSSHIAVYLIMFVSCAIMIFLHRFPEYSENRKLASIMFHIVPPGLNPIVYGLQTKEIRQKIVKLWWKKRIDTLWPVEKKKKKKLQNVS